MKLGFDCYQALLARDPRFDGQFFVAVKTTGIYCRPICPARPPLRKSCVFHETAAAAEQAGFRPCLRCRPELAPGWPAHSLAEALYAAIRAQAVQGDSVETIARRAGYSVRQLRRLMGQSFGVTPVEIMQTERLLFAKKLLQETPLATSEVALSAGFRSVRRFHALFQQRYGQAPSRLRHRRWNGSAAKTDTLRLRLSYRPPLAWRELLAYLQRRAVPGVEEILLDEQRYRRTVTWAGQTGWVEVGRATGGDWLEVTLPAELAPHSWPVLVRLRQLFDLDANPSAIHEALVPDERLRPSLQQHPGLRVPGAWSTFELAVRAVLGQQVSIAGATTLAGRLTARFGRPIISPFSKLQWLAVEPGDLAAAPVESIASIGLPRARAVALQELAAACARGCLDFQPAVSLENAVAQLRTVRGIGEWTAQYIAMRALRFPDAFPAGDLGLRKALRPSGEALSSERQWLAQAEEWRPWRAYAAMHLWQAIPSQSSPQLS